MNREPTPTVLSTVRSPLHRSSEVATDREPQADSAPPIAQATRQLYERIEDRAQLFVWNSGPGVGHVNRRRLRDVVADAERDLPAERARVLDRVRHEIEKNLSHAVWIRPHDASTSVRRLDERESAVHRRRRGASQRPRAAAPDAETSPSRYSIRPLSLRTNVSISEINVEQMRLVVSDAREVDAAVPRSPDRAVPSRSARRSRRWR